MSEMIRGEALFFLISVSTGAVLLFGFDLLRAVRAVFWRRKALLGVLDFLYWCLAGACAFGVIFQENSGILRGFSVIGMFLGMMVYHVSVSRWVFRLYTAILRGISTAILWVLHILCAPWRFCGKKFGKTAQKTLKKKVKEIRMYFNKQ